MELLIDRETYCELDLTEVGTYRYAEEAEDLLVAYAIDDGPAEVWDVTEDPEPPAELVDACERADTVWAHNAQFDKAIHKHQTALPPIELDRWQCSMALALSHALPGGLNALCEALDVPEDLAKLQEGGKLLRRFTRPQPDSYKLRRATRHTHPAEWERFKLYAANDIVAMRECMARIPRLNWDDSAVAEWHLDQRINERGFAVDMELIEAGARASVTEKEFIATRFLELSRGQFKPTQRALFLDFLQRHGVDTDNTRSDTFLQYLKHPEELDPEIVEMMKLSISANKTSTAKYATLQPAIQSDMRFRGSLQFAGASRTRRWAGRLFQPQNLPARGLPPKAVVDEYIRYLKMGVHEMFFIS